MANLIRKDSTYPEEIILSLDLQTPPACTLDLGHGALISWNGRIGDELSDVLSTVPSVDKINNNFMF